MKHYFTDIIQNGWIARLPSSVQPYCYLMRLDRPIGTWLLLLPAWWAMLLADGLSSWPFMILFAVGAVAMRGAGCIINDIWDRNLDGLVERTSLRPLPSGQIAVWQAYLLLFALLIIGLVVLLQLNVLTIIIGISSLFFVGIYPIMKRLTWWPQVFLGLTFNFGAIMGWTAVTGAISTAPIMLYLSCIFWTIGYDTIYALQDREDDAAIGIKSTARLFTEKWGSVRIPISIFYALHTIFLYTTINLTLTGLPSWGMILLIPPLVHLGWQVLTLSINEQDSALRKFKSNRDYGLMMAVVIWILYLI